ncbi:MAG: RecX family transcriptional regulator [Crocinitomicaceae bacterium]|nr:RecX family transcriptional regulator [Crocinitomicaceae bacterium]|tara:strand:- start:36329 stop:36811 length:483 start_codon:yes stop_codon:yes gene_type:complete
MNRGCKYTFLEAKFKLESLCAYQERCSFELQQKMIKWGVNEANQMILLDHLISNNYLDEERFVQTFISGKINIKRWGRIKIRKQLKQKFISEDLISKNIESIDIKVYKENLINLANKKEFLLKDEIDSYTKKIKIYRFLYSKGYEMDLIKDCVKRHLNLE